jgi:transposase
MRCKKIIDARSYTHETLEQMRRDAVKRVEGGESPEVVAQGLGINRRTMYRWLSDYHYGGEAALAAKPIPGAPRKLDGKQMQRLARIIQDKSPQQFKFEFALWTLGMIREVIKQKFGVSLSEVSVGRVMRRLGFSPQRPLYRAWQQDPERVQQWQDKQYPQIARRAKREGAVIMFADEASIRSDHHAGTSWAPAGKTPVVKATGARYSLSMISAVSARGGFRFMTVQGRVNAEVFREFLRRLIAGMTQKVFLIVDGHPVHKARLVQQFVQQHAHQIELFWLPPYAPELNPDELVWNHLKARVGKAAVQTKEGLNRMVERTLHRLQKLPEIVASFFLTPSCRYAAL